MNPVRRWLRFNIVGLAGMLVQLVTLAGLTHIVRGHYLLLSGIAVETAILHNFVAHVHYTWKDRGLHSLRDVSALLRNRQARAATLGALGRFQISNGGVSLGGNFIVMRLLVGSAHMPVLAANLVSIAVCGLANFGLGDRWAFAAETPTGQKTRSTAGARNADLWSLAAGSVSAEFPDEFRIQRIANLDAVKIADFPPERIAAYFRENPDTADKLLLESCDKRYNPSTFITEDSNGYLVGWLSSRGCYLAQRQFSNLADAATDYLLFSLGKGRWNEPPIQSE